MLMKILGAIDVIGGLILMFGVKFIPSFILIFFGATFLIKSLMGLLKDFASWTDFLSGINFLLMIFFIIPPIIGIILGIILVQKGIFSFL